MGNSCNKFSESNISFEIYTCDTDITENNEINYEKYYMTEKNFNPNLLTKIIKINENDYKPNLIGIKNLNNNETIVEINQLTTLKKNIKTTKPIESNVLPIDKMPKFYNNLYKNLPKFKFNKNQNYLSDTVKLGPFEFIQDETYYNGEWKYGQRNGKGELLCMGNKFFEGYFLNDMANEYYEGEWKNNKANGYGEYHFIDEVRKIYSGNWENGVQNGKGEEIYHDNTKILGNWVNGKLEGFVEIFYADGGKFEGFFKENQINGKGVQKWGDKREYIGNFLNGKLHGKGEFIWPSLNKYVGRYEEDKKNGYGEFYWKDGRKYLGIVKF